MQATVRSNSLEAVLSRIAAVTTPPVRCARPNTNVRRQLHESDTIPCIASATPVATTTSGVNSRAIVECYIRHAVATVGNRHTLQLRACLRTREAGSRCPRRSRRVDSGAVASSHAPPQFVPPQRHKLRAGGATVDVPTARSASSSTRRTPVRRSAVGGVAPPPRTRGCCAPGGNLIFRSPVQGESRDSGTEGATASCGSTRLAKKVPAWRATAETQNRHQSSQGGAAHQHEWAQDARPARLGGEGRASSPVRRSRPPVGSFRRTHSAVVSAFTSQLLSLRHCYVHNYA